MKQLLAHVMAFFIVVGAPLALAGDKEKPDSPKTISGATTIDARIAKALFDKGITFIDVRKDKDWKTGRIPGAVHLELKKEYSTDSLRKVVKKSQKVVLYCNGSKCMRSSKASAKAVKWGFTDVQYFRGGLPAWKAAGYLVATK